MNDARELASYYARRAGEYEQIYLKPEREPVPGAKKFP